MIEKIKRIVWRLSLREKIYSYGEDNPDMTYYVIRVDYKMAGILAIVKSILSHIVYAYDNNYIPVVDLLNCKCQYINPQNPENIWNWFYLQPEGIDLCDIIHSKKVIISKNIDVPSKKYLIRVDSLYNNKGLLNSYKEAYNKYIHFNKKTEQYVEDKYHKIIGYKKGILGVLARGTDYLDNKPKYHPVQPAPQDIIEKAKEVMEKYGYEYLFLATEDQRIYDLFKIHFGEKLLFNDQKLLDSTHGVNYISELDSKEGLSGKQDVLNYLTTLFILSKCSSFIGGCTSGTLGAYMMSEHFEYEYFWNLGLYK